MVDNGYRRIPDLGPCQGLWFGQIQRSMTVRSTKTSSCEGIFAGELHDVGEEVKKPTIGASTNTNIAFPCS